MLDLPSQDILSYADFFGVTAGNGFLWVSSYSALPCANSAGRGALQQSKWKGSNAAMKPTQPSGIFSDLERECLTGVAGGTAQQPTGDTSRNCITFFFNYYFLIISTGLFTRCYASTLGHVAGMWLADLSCPVSPLPCGGRFFPPQGCGFQLSAQSTFPEDTWYGHKSIAEAQCVTNSLRENTHFLYSSPSFCC